MDVLLSAALQEIAVEGTQGCTLPKLLSLLQGASLPAEIISNKRAKQLLWHALINVPGMRLLLPNSIAVANTVASVQDVDEVEKLGLQLVAPENLRESSLGMYDLQVCDARLSKEQRNVLECIAKSRGKGITQSQLAKEFKIPGNKMFYLVKMLEVRGLVVRQATLVRTVDGNSEGSKHVPIVATNLLHLTRYGKDLTLSSHQRFEIYSSAKDTTGDVPRSVSEDIDEEEGSLCKKREFIIKDDLPAMRAVCQKLEETDGKVLVVSDLKTSLGYRLAVGHRTWRRLVKRLQDAGLVEILSAQIEHKVRSCIRLVKSFDFKAFKGPNDETEGETSLKCAKRGQATDLVTELPIDQQIYNLIDGYGVEGVQMIEVFNSLGLQNKRNYYRISTMLERHLLVSEAENHKRSTLYRLKAARNLNDFAQLSVYGSHEEPKVEPYKETVTLSSLGLIEDSEEIMPPQSSCLTDGFVHLGTVKTSSRRALQQARMSQGKTKYPDSLQDHIEMVQEQVPEVEMKVEPAWNNTNTIVPVSNPHLMNHARQAELPLAISFIPHEFKDMESLTSNIPMSTTRAQREKRILEKLQAEMFVLRVELHRWLVEVENRKNIMMDRKTLSRMLQGLQASGHLKCVMLSMPGLTNCGRQRTTAVVLLPSLVIDPDLLSRVHEQVRKFDMMSRGHGVSRVKAKDIVPVLTGVPRMQTALVKRITKFDKQAQNGWSMQANGFIPAKMIRVRLLHYFLWGYVNNLPEDSGHLSDGSGGSGEVVGSCKIFGLAKAMQNMPLELFLQIIGSFLQIENVADWCKQGLCLSDLPKEDVLALLDSNATGRLSWLVDVLRRLKLVRLVMGCGQAASVDQEEDLGKPSILAVLTYAMEREPYLEEPATYPLPSMNLDAYDVSPRARHEFNIVNKDGLDTYWQNLEYFYSGAQPVVARCAFPGSSVPELFGLRSWATVKVMTIGQRTELMKRVSIGGVEQRIPWSECVKIAKQLNLSLQQVLRVSYEKNRVYRLQTLQKVGQTLRKRGTVAGDLNEAPHVKAYKKQRQELATIDKEVRSKSLQTDLLVIGDHRKANSDDDDDDTEVPISVRPLTDDFSFVGNMKPYRPQKFQLFRSRRFQWSDRLDRLLIASYCKQRAQLGALYHRVDWDLMAGLPAPPRACRRRMAQLRLDPGVRKAMMSLCTLLTLRYIHYSQSQVSTNATGVNCASGSGSEIASVANYQNLASNCGDNQCVIQLVVSNVDMSSVQPELDDPTSNSGPEFNWDDMIEPFLAAALDEVMRCRGAGKAISCARGIVSRGKPSKCPNSVDRVHSNHGDSYLMDKHADSVSEATVPNDRNLSRRNLEVVAAAGAAFSQLSALARLTVNPLTPTAQNSALHDEVMSQRTNGQLPGRALSAAGPTRKARKQVRSTLQRSTVIQVLTNEQLVQNSVAVANAVELVKLTLLNCDEEAELSGILVEAVQRFKESEILTAVKYLRERGFLVAGQGGQTCVLSPKFFHDCSVSRFPIETGKECLKTEQWFKTHSKQIEQDWSTFPSEPQCGQLSHLLALVSTNDFSLTPLLPLSTIGEAEENRTSKRKSTAQCQREYIRNVKVRTSFLDWSPARRVRGFPGIEVLVIRSRRSLATILDTFGSASGGVREPLVEETISYGDLTNNDEVVGPSVALTTNSELHDDRNERVIEEVLSGIDPLFTELDLLPDFPYGRHQWGPQSEKNGEKWLAEFVSSCGVPCAGEKKSNIDDCILHWWINSTTILEGISNLAEVPPDLLCATYSAVEQAGEEGFCLEKFVGHLQLAEMDTGLELKKIGGYVHALEAFGLVKRVNAYEHTLIVEDSKSSRFYLHIPYKDGYENARAVGEDMPDSGKQLVPNPQGATEGCDGINKTDGVFMRFETELLGNSPDLASQLLIGIHTTSPVVTAQNSEHRIISLKPDGRIDTSIQYVAIVPWLSQYGTINMPMLRGLMRRVMGIITIHPGIPEASIVEQVKVLNPQSLRQLLQILELDGHVVVRSSPALANAAPSGILQAFVVGHSNCTNDFLIKHYFVNPLADQFL